MPPNYECLVMVYLFGMCFSDCYYYWQSTALQQRAVFDPSAFFFVHSLDFPFPPVGPVICESTHEIDQIKQSAPSEGKAKPPSRCLFTQVLSSLDFQLLEKICIFGVLFLELCGAVNELKMANTQPDLTLL